MWYSPRADATVASQGASFGVFYPDMDKMTSFAGFPQNGPPGYPFKTGVDAKNADPNDAGQPPAADTSPAGSVVAEVRTMLGKLSWWWR